MFDLLLALYLLILFPALQMRASLRKRRKGDRTRIQRYRSTALWAALPLVLLAASSWWSARLAADLGLAWPPSAAGWWGLLAAVLLPLALHVGGTLWSKRTNSDKRATLDALARKNDVMPRTPQELRVFVATTVFACAAWEILYRGFLVAYLMPLTGMAGAIVLPALAYGIGHGFLNVKQAVSSIAMALLFTAAYVWTGSLWWLIVLHAALPLMGALGMYKTLRDADPAPVRTRVAARGY